MTRRFIPAMMLSALLVSTLTEAAEVRRSEALAYCLGSVEFSEKFKVGVAHTEEMQPNLKALAPEMRELARRDTEEAALLRGLLRKLGALGQQGLRRAEDAAYGDGYSFARTCTAHSLQRCVQACYKSGRFSDSTEAWSCEKVCGLPQSCKPKFDCKEFGVTS